MKAFFKYWYLIALTVIPVVVVFDNVTQEAGIITAISLAVNLVFILLLFNINYARKDWLDSATENMKSQSNNIFRITEILKGHGTRFEKIANILTASRELERRCTDNLDKINTQTLELVSIIKNIEIRLSKLERVKSRKKEGEQ